MSRRPRRPGPAGRLARGLAAAGVTLVSALGGIGTAAAAPLPIEQCTTTSGVVLAVDLGHWGGPLLRSCGTTPTTGYALLNQGGWKTTGTGHDGPAFICRIGYSGYQGGKQYPTPDQEKCVLTPPATSYWSYWHADPGQNTWSYSQLGAMSYQPKPGSVDLWIFGGTNIEGTEGKPTFSPDTVRAHNTAPGGGSGQSTPPKPPTTPPPPGGGSGGANGGTTNGSTSGGTAAGTNGGAKPPAAGTAPQPGTSAGGTTPTDPTANGSAPASPEATGSPSAAPSADPSAAPSPTDPSAAPGGGTKVVDAAPAADAPQSTGSVVPVVVGAAIVVALGAATAVAAVRRRRQAE
ncbi:hypothetical protein [Kitasatospora sp. NPDC094015]|uniref:hypothetical protein n=1 Tax=Kitasatospora sp. NPDC094015 TaxID=3155205 RepID=UPI0033197125